MPLQANRDLGGVILGADCDPSRFRFRICKSSPYVERAGGQPQVLIYTRANSPRIDAARAAYAAFEASKSAPKK